MSQGQQQPRPRVSLSLGIFLASVFGLAGLVLARASASILAGAAVPTYAELAFWFVLSLCAEAFWIETPTRRGMISMSLAVNLASLFVLPFGAMVWVAATSVLTADLLFHRRNLLRGAFNGAQTVLSLAACAGVLGAATPTLGIAAVLLHPLPTLATPALFFVVNTGLVALAIALETRRNPWTAWVENFGFAYQALSTTGLFLTGLSLVAAYETVGFIGGLFFVVVFLLVRDGYGRYVDTHGHRDLPGVRG